MCNSVNNYISGWQHSLTLTEETTVCTGRRVFLAFAFVQQDRSLAKTRSEALLFDLRTVIQDLVMATRSSSLRLKLSIVLILFLTTLRVIDQSLTVDFLNCPWLFFLPDFFMRILFVYGELLRYSREFIL